MSRLKLGHHTHHGHVPIRNTYRLPYGAAANLLLSYNLLGIPSCIVNLFLKIQPLPDLEYVCRAEN